MRVYTRDNMIFTNAKVQDDVVYKIIDTMEKNKADMVADAAGAARVLGRPRSTSNTTFPITPAP